MLLSWLFILGDHSGRGKEYYSTVMIRLYIVDIWKSGSTRASETMALVRLLYFAAAKHNINVYVTEFAKRGLIHASDLVTL